MVIILIDSVLIMGAYEILNAGFSGVDGGGHVLFGILVLVWLVGGGIVQCVVLKSIP